MIGRRGFITGLVSLVAAPAIVRAGNLMPVKVIEPLDLSECYLFGRGPMTLAQYSQSRLAALHIQRQAWFRMMTETSEIVGDVQFIRTLPRLSATHG